MKSLTGYIAFAIVLACSGLLTGCPTSSAFVDVAIVATPDNSVEALVVDFEGMASALPPFSLVIEPEAAAEKVMATEPVEPCPEDENEEAVIELEVVEWFWDFGLCCGSATALGQQVSHTFPAPGCYVVTLVVTLSDGEMITVQEEVCI